MSTRKAVFYTFAFFLFVLIVPQLCAQDDVKMSASQAAIARQKMVDYSKQFIGKPYVSGAVGPNSFDCSGLIFTVSRESIGVQLPRTTKAMFNFCKEIDANTREAGDLVFFKTTSSGQVSHVGLYIGGSQFIHAVSDGPNTGVIISSLKENYWKSHYYCTRRYLPPSNSELLADSDPKNYASSVVEKSTGAGSFSDSSSSRISKQTLVRSDSDSFLESIILDASLSIDWSLFTTEYFRLNCRGFDTMIHARYAGKVLQPGLGTYIRYDAGTGNVQLPIVLSLSFNEFFRIFAGPVLSLGSPSLPGDPDTEIENSFFPGIIGACFSTPSVKIGKTFLSLVQDIHYTVFNDTDGSALSIGKSFASGLVFATGLRVTLPLKSVL
ncbi:MAG: C40 family peptidase [Treponema sp.]|nr:C40 family peptidase [Treponema sp.]